MQGGDDVTGRRHTHVLRHVRVHGAGGDCQEGTQQIGRLVEPGLVAVSKIKINYIGF